MLKNELEALLFSSGRKMSIDELSKLTRTNPEDIKAALTELKKEYKEKNSSTMVVHEGDTWKLSVREQFLPLVQKIVTETELSKTVMETLAVIAFKYPIKQSDLIKIRTNKAYDHLKELEDMGYISRQKHGRSYLIKLTQKFFEYFDLPEEKLKEQFKDFESIAAAIEEKEKDIESIKQQQKARAEEEKKEKEKMEEGISLDEKETVQTYEDEEPKTPDIKEYREKLGKLDVVDEPSDEELEEDRERLEKIKEEGARQTEERREQEKKPKFKGKGIKVTKEMEKIIDKKVEAIMHPHEDKSEENHKNEKSEETSKESNK